MFARNFTPVRDVSIIARTHRALARAERCRGFACRDIKTRSREIESIILFPIKVYPDIRSLKYPVGASTEERYIPHAVTCYSIVRTDGRGGVRGMIRARPGGERHAKLRNQNVRREKRNSKTRNEERKREGARGEYISYTLDTSETTNPRRISLNRGRSLVLDLDVRFSVVRAINQRSGHVIATNS